MTQSDLNQSFEQTSFLYGGNAAYIEELHAKYQADPHSVDAQWQAFFASLKDDGAAVKAQASGPSWERADWPRPGTRGAAMTCAPRR